MAQQPPPQWARAASFTRFLDHTPRRTAVGRTPLDEWSARPLPDNTQHSQQTDINAPGGIFFGVKLVLYCSFEVYIVVPLYTCFVLRLVWVYRPLPDNTQHSQQTDINALCEIRTHNPSKRAASDLRFRPRGHWHRRPSFCCPQSFSCIAGTCEDQSALVSSSIGLANNCAF